MKFVVARFTLGAPATSAPFSTILVPSSSVSDVMRWPGVVTLNCASWTWAVLVVSTVILKPLICGKRPLAPGSAPTPHSISSFKRAGLTLDDGTKIVENGALVAGAPSVNLATTNFTANNGDSYPFRDLKGVAAGVPYQQSLYDYIVNELAGKVTAAQYPVGGKGRIVITP